MEETAGVVVEETTLVETVEPAIVVTVAPAIVDDGITPVTKESSVNLDGKHAPGPVGASPSADATDDTRTCRPASVGWILSRFNTPV